MSAHVRETTPDTMMSPAKVASYIASLEAKLGRRVDRATILPNGGIDVSMASPESSTNPADLVDMSE